MIGTVFNRPEKEYLVVFDDYSKNLNPYINTLAEKNKLRAYKVDMSKPENAKYRTPINTKTDANIIKNFFNPSFSVIV